MSKIDLSKLPEDVRKEIEAFHRAWVVEKASIDSGQYTFATSDIERVVNRMVDLMHTLDWHIADTRYWLIMRLVDHIVYGDDSSDSQEVEAG